MDDELKPDVAYQAAKDVLEMVRDGGLNLTEAHRIISKACHEVVSIRAVLNRGIRARELAQSFANHGFIQQENIGAVEIILRQFVIDDLLRADQELLSFVRMLSRQPLEEEMDDEMQEQADYVGAYEAFIKDARAVLTKLTKFADNPPAAS